MKDIKRQNFNVDADQAATLEAVRVSLHAQSTKDAILSAARLVRVLASMLKSGDELYIKRRSGDLERVLIPELEPEPGEWTYLITRSHPWRRQLYIKGRRLLASTVWGDMIANGMSPQEAAEDRDLPLEAVLEAVKYCEQNRELIALEAQEERQRLVAAGVRLDAPASR